ncbi:uncharacterized protein LOC143446919 [Clavelina lepadiformis]|uniref:uncharacterized protein LOC143446919 n=1 Tax=Clavelina lepadiformis TaxID=159417 RepID=UPI004043249B
MKTIQVVAMIWTYCVAPSFHSEISTSSSDSRLDCMAQKTPFQGEKWCLFKRSANELGAICYFKCNEGYTLVGHSINECVLAHAQLKATYFNVSGGICKRIVDFPENVSGPYYITTEARTGYHLSTDGRYRLVVTKTTGMSNMFYVRRPGLNQEPGSISLYSASHTDHYVALQGQRLLVIPENFAHPILGSWSNVTSFYYHRDMFTKLKGCYALQPYLDEGKFLILGDDNQVNLKKHDDPDFNRTRANFLWKKSSS